MAEDASGESPPLAPDPYATRPPTPDLAGMTPPDPTPPIDAGGASLAPGEKVGENYEIAERLGAGGMGQVYRARHLRLDRDVALKVIGRRCADGDAAAARFRREMKAGGRLDHPNVVRTTDAGEHKGRLYLVMDLVSGCDLERLVKLRGSLRAADACEVARQAAHGLQAIHDKGLIHRDIKPSNLMLTRGGLVKVLDLGLARLAGDAADALTQNSSLGGTPDYMAPEQAGDLRAATIRSDLYSLGCTLYYLLAGRAPFEDDDHRSLRSKLIAHLEEPPPSIAGFRPDLAGGTDLIQVLDRLLAKDPGARPSEPRQLADDLLPLTLGHDLAGLFADSPAPAPPMTPDEPAPSHARRRRVFMLGTAVGIVGMAAAASGLWWEVGPKTHPRPTVSQPDRRAPVTPPVDARPLKAVLDVWAWPAGESDRPGRRLHDPGVLPLKPGDLIHIEATTSRPAYLYLVWLDAAGGVTPIWPWRGGKWNDRPAERDRPRAELHIPDDVGLGMPMRADTAGVQVLLLLARDNPLTSDADLQAHFKDWPKQSGLDPLRMAAAAWFEDGEPPPSEENRSPFHLGETRTINDPVWRARGLARGELRREFTTTRIVCFTFRGQ